MEPFPSDKFHSSCSGRQPRTIPRVAKFVCLSQICGFPRRLASLNPRYGRTAAEVGRCGRNLEMGANRRRCSLDINLRHKSSGYAIQVKYFFNENCVIVLTRNLKYNVLNKLKSNIYDYNNYMKRLVQINAKKYVNAILIAIKIANAYFKISDYVQACMPAILHFLVWNVLVWNNFGRQLTASI